MDGFAAAVRELCLSPSANRKDYPGNPITPLGARKCPDDAQILIGGCERWTGGRLRPPKIAELAPVFGPRTRSPGDRPPGLPKATWLKRRSKSTAMSVFLVTIALWAYTVFKFALCDTIEM